MVGGERVSTWPSCNKRYLLHACHPKQHNLSRWQVDKEVIDISGGHVLSFYYVRFALVKYL